MKRVTPAIPSQMDLWRIIEQGSEAKRVPGEPDALLAVYKNRFTYTFILNGEVASVHFDGEKGKIYFKGSHIMNMELTPQQIEVLQKMREILEADERATELLGSYEATLEHSIDDN